MHEWIYLSGALLFFALSVWMSTVALNLKRAMADVDNIIDKLDEVEQASRRNEIELANFERKITYLLKELKPPDPDEAHRQAVKQKLTAIASRINIIEADVDRDEKARCLEQALTKAILEHSDSLMARIIAVEKMVERQQSILWATKNTVTTNSQMLTPIMEEVNTWQQNPLARRRDVEKKKVVVLVDFDNIFISLCKQNIEIISYRAMKNLLIDPEKSGRPIQEKIIAFTNKSRWRRKDYYDRHHNISQMYAKKVRAGLRQEGFRIIEPESNVDIPLTLLALAIAEKGEVEEFILVVNDGTYAGLATKLSDMGCLVTGIMIGEEAAGDLISCYNDLGLEKHHWRQDQDFQKFAVIHRENNKEPEKEQQQPEQLLKNLNKWAKKNCYTPVKSKRQKYLEYLYTYCIHPFTQAQLRKNIKKEFPDTNGNCRYTLGKVLVKSDNLQDLSGEQFSRYVNSLETWLINAEKTWIELVVDNMHRMIKAQKLSCEMLVSEVILREIMGYSPDEQNYQELIKHCEWEINKISKIFE